MLKDRINTNKMDPLISTLVVNPFAGPGAEKLLRRF
jgi:hypothetical protein